MKRFICIFICLLSFTLFAEDFSLFPWVCNQKDVYTFCTNKGWEYSSDVTSAVTSFSFKPSLDVKYHNQSIYSLHFMFDDAGNLISQAISFNDLLTNDTLFASVLEHAIKDKARLLSQEYEKDELYNIYIYADITDKVKAIYIIVGENNNYQLSINYHTY